VYIIEQTYWEQQSIFWLQVFVESEMRIMIWSAWAMVYYCIIVVVAAAEGKGI
jgi:hypothetical protein